MKLYPQGGYLYGDTIVEKWENLSQEEAKRGTISYGILQNHNQGEDENMLRIKFDSLTSHDITYVSIIQTARASGLKEFPIPYVLTNCHNSLCAVGGTINEDDHMFALSAAKKYGGTYVPTNMAVIHSYNREEMTKCGNMILGSDSHTRYGALGTMSIGEGGGELVKQLLKLTYDMPYPNIVGVVLKGKPKHGVGPQDVALAIIKEVFPNGFVKNCVMEFVGSGIKNLPVEYRNGIDVMTTETTCLSSIWQTDDQVKEYYKVHGRKDDYQKLEPKDYAYYDRLIEVDLGEIEPMIALPFHPSNAYPIRYFLKHAKELLAKVQEEAQKQFPNLNVEPLDKYIDEDGNFHVQQAIVAGCSGGTYDNLSVVSNIMKGFTTGSGRFTMSVYPGSQPINLALSRNGTIAKLLESGIIVREAFCGPCFGAGDTPSNGSFSIRHTTRNFLNREGSKPGEGQLSYVALMDARSIAATARNQGKLTPADEIEYSEEIKPYEHDTSIYKNRVFVAEKPEPETELIMGPNIKDWPEMPVFKEHLLVRVASSLKDAVTTTDELIPSGETSSYRSNPMRLAEFTLSRRDPGYVQRAKDIALSDLNDAQYAEALEAFKKKADFDIKDVNLASAIFANKPGDGSAREQAASNQRVLGGGANFAKEYATKRYRGNLLNWGIFPFLVKEELEQDDLVFVPELRKAVENDLESFTGYIFRNGKVLELPLSLAYLTEKEKTVLLAGCLINYMRSINE
ncbi:MAG: hydratase [Eubacteriales bacterium]|nr:hydratase [Eubacteriales bacterium]